MAVFTSAYAKAGDEISVLAVARTVPQGQVVQPGDLTVAHIPAGAGIASIPSTEAATVVGRRAAERLSPRSLLSSSDVVSTVAPPAGASIVGIEVKEGQFPAAGLAPGERVDIVLTAPPGDQDPAVTSETPASGSADPSGGTADAAPDPGTVLVPGAMIVDLTPSPDAGSAGAVDASLLVASSSAPDVAAAAAADQIALVVVA
ncbi:MAG: SAF domain-containing protein [Acidimicrobiales bacterium]